MNTLLFILCAVGMIMSLVLMFKKATRRFAPVLMALFGIILGIVNFTSTIDLIGKISVIGFGLIGIFGLIVPFIAKEDKSTYISYGLVILSALLQVMEFFV